MHVSLKTLKFSEKKEYDDIERMVEKSFWYEKFSLFCEKL